MIDLAQDMDVSSPMMPVPSLALGTSETSLLEMVNAYATIADYGVRRNVTAITSISDKEGHIVATFPSEPDRVLSEQTSYTMINMLRKAVDQGTGGWLRTRFGIQGDVAGKTGTTQNNADGWFVAMHPDAVVGAWVGFKDQRVTFTSDYWGQGGHNALLLVGDFLQSGSKGPAAYISSSEFKRPAAYQNPKNRSTPAPPKHIDLAAIGGELREPSKTNRLQRLLVLRSPSPRSRVEREFEPCPPLRIEASDIHRFDLHLGKDISSDQDSLTQLAACLESTRPDHLIFLGDVFDAFIDTGKQPPSVVEEWASRIKPLLSGGCRVTYLMGNHDRWHRGYIEQLTGNAPIRRSMLLDWAGQHIQLEHGDFDPRTMVRRRLGAGCLTYQ